ncbi:MAG: hypothetical protein MUF30_12295 [Burkholderiales bacterium]|jgi:hypothetical protein|nr:hypothetical protein [Burkholderiales bacterium]
MSPAFFVAATVAVAALSPRPASAYSICQDEIESITRAARGVPMTEQQKLEFAPLMDDAIKRCRIGRDEVALLYFARARAVVGLPPRVAVDAEDPAAATPGTPAR